MEFFIVSRRRRRFSSWRDRLNTFWFVTGMTILKTCLQPHFRRSMIQQDNMEAVQSVDTRFHVPHGIQREHNENNTAQGQKHKIKKVQEENVNESNEYERLRNERVLENKTKMLELFPQIKVASSNVKRKRIATLKVVEAICDSTMEASKPKAKKSTVDGDKLLDAALAKDMGMQYQVGENNLFLLISNYLLIHQSYMLAEHLLNLRGFK
ncbi:hypothetical protein M758_UG328600 [Ceratodon purpureus]|nr:hypothetical protein M758_UG328600 [Ceratodon purpureus]